MNVAIKDEQGTPSTLIDHAKSFSIDFEINVLREVKEMDIYIIIKNTEGLNIFYSSLSDKNSGNLRDFKAGKYSFSVKFEKGFLLPNNYSLTIAISTGDYRRNLQNIDERKDVIGFRVFDNSGASEINRGVGSVLIPNKWIEQKNAN